MSPTILDMVQVFGLRHLGRVMDVTHDWSHPSRPIAESLGTSSNTVEVDVELDEEAGDAFVLQKAEAEVAKQGAGEGGDVFELLGDSEVKVKPVVGTRATRRTKAIVVESSEFEPEKRPRAQFSIPGQQVTPTKKKTRAQISKAFKFSTVTPVEAGLQATKKPTFVSREEPLGVEIHQKAKGLLDSTL
ncbi:hypothetical protein ACFX1W_021949 [Malus domestica]